jgi:polyhydroxybutyrate depolymerase
MTMRNRRILLIIVILLLIFAFVLRRTRARQAPEPESTLASAPSGTQSATLEFGGRARTYLLHIPPGYDAKTPAPLVFVLHGATESADNVEKLTGMSAKADQEHFIAVYPYGTGRLSEVPTWNAGNCCGYAIQNNVDDIGFFRALIEKLESEYSINHKRIYFTGISNGAMMSYRVACEMAGEVAAIAPVEGALNVECHPSAPVSVLIFHGTADRLVPFNGGSTLFQVGDKRTDTSVPFAVSFWVERDACSSAPAHEEIPELHVDKYSGCQDGTAVQLYAIQGGHHMWPGVAISGNTVPATDLIWSFFAAHPKP